MRVQNAHFIWACIAIYNYNIIQSAVFMISDNILILHILHFITAHFRFITAHLCSDNPLFYALVDKPPKVINCMH